MKNIKVLFITLLFAIVPIKLHTGFVAGTLVKTPHGYQAIEQLTPQDLVYSFDKEGNSHTSKIKATYFFTSSRTIMLEIQGETICTTARQKFYNRDTNSWQKAKSITTDTSLYSLDHQLIPVLAINETDQASQFFDIELEDVHTFCITKHDIIVHNFPPLAIGISCAFGGGIVLEGIYGSLCVAGLWFGTKLFKKDPNNKHSNITAQPTVSCNPGNTHDDIIAYTHYNHNQGAQAPGKPTENDGFVPKKNWDGKKVKHPKTGQVGWPDKKGDVWVPTGVGPLAHRGPHWDVIDKKGKHRNVLPGGRTC